jgi:hypothetical protein
MAGETVAYEVQTILIATCSAEAVDPPSEGQRMEARTEEAIDDAVVGHLIMAHDWSKAAAQAYVAGKVYTPPSIQDPPTP